MELTPIDAALLALGMAGELILFAILVSRRLYRSFPIFTAYVFYAFVSDLVAFIFRHISADAYFLRYFVGLAPEFLFQLGVLIEVARNVLVPVKTSLPRASLLLFAAMVVGGILVGILLSVYTKSSKLTALSQSFVQINFTFAIIRMVIFSAIAVFAQMLGIGWKNHVLHIATGIASYSIIVLLIKLLHRILGVSDAGQYHFLEQVGIVAWCASLGYWSYFFSKKEGERKEFSPKMAQFLISLMNVDRENRPTASRVYPK